MRPSLRVLTRDLHMWKIRRVKTTTNWVIQEVYKLKCLASALGLISDIVQRNLSSVNMRVSLAQIFSYFKSSAKLSFNRWRHPTFFNWYQVLTLILAKPQDTCTAQLKTGRCLQTVLLKKTKLEFSSKLWVVPLSRSPSSETANKPRGENPEVEKRANFSPPGSRAAIFFRVTLDGLSDRGTTIVWLSSGITWFNTNNTRLGKCPIS